MKFNEKLDFLNQRVDTIENSSSEITAADADKLKTNFEQMMKKQDQFEKILLEFIQQNEEKLTPNVTKIEVISELKSQCASLCESKMNIWEKETSNKFKGNLEKVGLCIDNSVIKSDSTITTISNFVPHSTNGAHEYETTVPSATHEDCYNANNCWQLNNTAYYVFDLNLSWDEAYNKCMNEGMNLAMPREKEITEFLVSKLKPIYKGEPTKHFWIGLKNDASGNYQWIDGTPLGDYTGGNNIFKIHKEDRRGLIEFHKGTSYWWPREVGTNRFIQYALCEKHIAN